MSELRNVYKKTFDIFDEHQKKPPKRYSDFKPTEIPDGFAIAIDTREQLPLFTTVRLGKDEKRIEKNGLVLVGKTLANGDYSVCELEKLVTIERKQQSDFESYITSEYSKKTKPKLERLKDYYFKALVVEADEYELYECPMSDFVTREMVRNQIVSMQIRYGMHIIISNDRKYIERKVLDWLVRCYKYLVLEKIKEMQTELKEVTV